MIIHKPENRTDQTEVVYVCDNCGGFSNFTDYWWPGHVHWAGTNFTLCNDCLHFLGLQVKTEKPTLPHQGK